MTFFEEHIDEEGFLLRYTPEFLKDFKNLQKRFNTLEEDFQIFVKFLLKPHHKGSPNPQIKQISNIGMSEVKFYKARKFICKALRSSNEIRVIYAYQEIEDVKIITFIEIYYKGDKENEDKERIRRFLKG